MCEVETVNEKFTLQSLNIPKDVRDKINPNTHFVNIILTLKAIKKDAGNEQTEIKNSII